MLPPTSRDPTADRRSPDQCPHLDGHACRQSFAARIQAGIDSSICSHLSSPAPPPASTPPPPPPPCSRQLRGKNRRQPCVVEFAVAPCTDFCRHRQRHRSRRWGLRRHQRHGPPPPCHVPLWAKKGTQGNFQRELWGWGTIRLPQQAGQKLLFPWPSRADLDRERAGVEVKKPGLMPSLCRHVHLLTPTAVKVLLRLVLCWSKITATMAGEPKIPRADWLAPQGQTNGNTPRQEEKMAMLSSRV